jgi:hypothetical protein
MSTSAAVRERSTPVTYQLGTSAAAGVWLGFSAGRIAVVGVGLLVSILSFTAGVPAQFAVVPLLLCGLLTVARAAGRPLLEWVSPVLGHQFSAATGATGWCAPFPTSPTRRASSGLRLPHEYGRVRLTESADDPTIGLVVDTAARTVTAVFDIAGVDRFPLLEPEDRDMLIGGWGQALAILADTDDTLVRLQLIERARYETPIDAAASDIDDDDALRRTVEALSTRHDSRLAVQWSVPRIDNTTLATMPARCRGVSRSLLTARLVTRPLSAMELGRDIATSFRGLQYRDPSTSTPGPISRRTAWSHVVTDEICHRGFAIVSWPQTAVTADWLAPLLLSAPSGVTRTVAIHLERVTPAAAARTARTARAKAALDQRDRVRLGMTTSAAIDRAESSGVAMDDELAAGFRTHRLSGLVTLSGDTPQALDDAARWLKQAAATARLELRPLHGQHEKALAATAPLCRVRSGGQA